MLRVELFCLSQSSWWLSSIETTG